MSEYSHVMELPEISVTEAEREAFDAILAAHETNEALKHDPVRHPKHYTSHPSGVECIQITEHFGFNLGNVIKYLWRAEEKGAPLQDLEKAAWYLEREIERRRGK